MSYSSFSRRTFVHGALAAVLFLFFASTTFADEVEIKINFDRENCIYSVGEDANFTVAVLDGAGAPVKTGVMTVKATNDGRNLVSEQTFDLAKDEIPPFKTTLEEPGFVKVFVYLEIPREKDPVDMCELASAGFDPEKIEPGLPMPEDFDEFWERGRKEVREIPIDAQMRKLDEFSNERRDFYAVSFATINNQRVYGFLGIPKTGEAPYPTLVNIAYAGAGVGPDIWRTDPGFVTFTMNVFPYEVPTNDEAKGKAYDDYNKSLDCNYFEYNMGDRDKYFYRAPILGIDRAVDWLAEQDFVDPQRIGYHGTSQGGGMGLALTSMNKHISRAMISVPAMCDHAGILKGRNAGWPELVDSWRIRNNPEQVEKTREALRYYDAANFARSIEIPITFTVGFRDVTCCPSSVFAAYNVVPSKFKQIRCGTKVWHTNDTNYNPAFNELADALRAPKCPIEGDWIFDSKFSDEFNSGFDDFKWYPNNPTWLGRQPGFFSKENVTVEGGLLKLTARNESKGDPAKGYKDFTTAAVKSKERVRYGYFEVRSKSMKSVASSSFWFYADDPDLWTEIDVFETSGNHKTHGSLYHMNLHVMKSPETGDRHIAKEKTWKAPFRFADDFHRYGLLWTPEKLCWYVDDELVRETENEYWNQPLTVNFDSETMPEWFGLPDPEELPATFEIDYIRHWATAN